MAGANRSGTKIGIIMATSLGPLMIMFDLAAVAIVQGGIEFGFGPFGGSFPSFIGIIGIVTWSVGISFMVYRRFSGSRKPSTRTRPIFLKGRKRIRCPSCSEWIDASDVGYQEVRTCECGAIYNMFQEGPWDDEVRGEGSVPSKAHRKPRGNDRPPRKIAPPPGR